MEAAAQNQSARGADLRLIRFVWNYVRPYRRMFFASVALMPLNTALALCMPYIIQLIIDLFLVRRPIAPPHWLAAIFASTGGPHLATMGAIYLSLVLCELAAMYSQSIITAMVAQYSLSDMRLSLFNHVERLPMSFFDRTPIGRLVSRITTDIDAISEMFAQNSLTIFVDVMTMCGIVMIMWAKSPHMAAWTLIAIPPLLILINAFRVRARLVYRQIRERLAAVNAYLAESLAGMTIIQLFTRERTSHREFDNLNRHSRDAQMLANIYETGLFSSVDTISSITIGLVLWVGGGEVFRHAITLGTLIAFMQYAQLFFMPLREISGKFTTLQSALAAVERIENLMAEPRTISSPPEPLRPAATRGRIVFDRVEFEYRRGEPVLRDLGFTVEPGRKIAIVGATGSGKSTIIKLLNRFYDVKGGRILVDGVDVRDWDLRELRRAIGLVQQDVFLFAGDVAENIRLGQTGLDDAKVREALDRAQALGFVDRLPLGIHEQIRERGSNLSAGQRQLLSFARALAYDPPILVMDEATSSVDSETERLIQLALDELLAHRTAVVIAHRLSTIQRADRILVLSNGVLRESGTHEELLQARGLYYRLFELQYAASAAAPSQAAD